MGNIKYLLGIIIGLIGIVVSYGALFKRPIECGYPINYYLKTTNINGNSSINEQGCMNRTGLWYNTFTREEYTKVYDLQIGRFIPRDWLVDRDQLISSKTLIDLNDDLDNLYTIGKHDPIVIPFKEKPEINHLTCTYYIQLDVLFRRYKLTYLDHEAKAVTSILENCSAAKIRGDLTLVF